MQKQLNSRNGKQMGNEYETLVRMTWKNDPELVAEAEKAFSELYESHRDYVLAVIRKVCRHWPYTHKEEIAKELFNDIFLRVFDKAETIRAAMEKYQDKSADEFRKILRSYIGQLANKEIARYLKKESTNRDNHRSLETMAYFEPYYEPDFDDPEDEPQNNLTEINKWTEFALSQLSPVERDVLLTVYLYIDPKKDLPDSVIQELCGRHGITPGNMRVIKSRAIKKFERIMTEKTGLQPMRLQQEKNCE